MNILKRQKVQFCGFLCKLNLTNCFCLHTAVKNLIKVLGRPTCIWIDYVINILQKQWISIARTTCMAQKLLTFNGRQEPKNNLQYETKTYSVDLYENHTLYICHVVSICVNVIFSCLSITQLLYLLLFWSD